MLDALVSLLQKEVELRSGVLFQRKLEEDDSDIPCILNYLQGELDNAWDNRAYSGKMRYMSPCSETNMAYCLWNIAYEDCKALLERVESESAQFYILTNEQKSNKEGFCPHVIPVEEAEFMLYSGALDEEDHVIWTRTGTTVNGFRFLDWTDGAKYVGVVEKQDNILSNSYFMGTKYLYVNPEQSRVRYFKCKDCGEYFYLRGSEVLFYKQKGLSLPKRCQSCRNKRKSKK